MTQKVPSAQILQKYRSKIATWAHVIYIYIYIYVYIYVNAGFSPTGGMGGFPTISQKFAHSPPAPALLERFPLHQIFILSPPKVNSPPPPPLNKNFQVITQ